MKTMMVRGSPILRYMLAAAAIVIVIFGLKYSSDVLAPIFLAATLAILFTPALWWLEKKGLPAWLALLVMVLALGGFIILMIIILTASLEQLALRLPVYEELLLQRIDAFTAALGSIGIDVQEALNTFVVNTTALTKTVSNPDPEQSLERRSYHGGVVDLSSGLCHIVGIPGVHPGLYPQRWFNHCHCACDHHCIHSLWISNSFSDPCPGHHSQRSYG